MANASDDFTYANETIATGFTAPDVGFSWAGDLNGDGYGDLIVTGASYPPNGNTLQQGRVFFGDGSGSFTLASTNVFPWQNLLNVHAREIITGDFNGDGRPDVYIAAHGYDDAPYPGEQDRLFLSAPGGTWIDATANLPQINDFTHSVAVGDINGDGYQDLYVGNLGGGANDGPYVLLGDGTGHFTQSYSILPTGVGQPLSLSQGSYTSSLLQDLNGDGRPDLIVGSSGSGPGNNQSLIFWNTGSGYSASDYTALPQGQFPDSNHVVVDVASFDVNGDGRNDILTLSTQYSPFYDGWTVDIYLNNGDGTFVDASSRLIGAANSKGGITSSGGTWAAFLSPIDVNHDGAMDFVISDYSGAGATSTSPIVFLNDGTGHFASVPLSSLPASDSFDYNMLPVATANGYSFVSPYSQNGDLNLSVAVANAPFPTPAHLHFGETLATDFNGDGHSDILWRNDDGNLTEWQVTGDTGQLTPNAYGNAGVGPDWHVAETFDFNGDGLSDILWRNAGTGQFTVWEGAAGGGFAQNAYSDTSVGRDWQIAAVGDLNGDGRDDIVWHNEATGTVTTWQSTGTGFSENVAVYQDIPLAYQIVGTGDFNGDGKADLLWRDQTTGQFTTWDSNGQAFDTNVYTDSTVGTDWHVQAIAGFDGDGKSDLLWRNAASGEFTIWTSTGTGFTPNTYVDTSVSSDWQIAQTGDFNGDGKADILWRNSTTGTFTIWQSEGHGFDENVAVQTGVGTDWHVQGHEYLYG